MFNKTAKIEIWFEESNWNDLLNQFKKEGKDQRLLAKVRINEVSFDSVGIKYKGSSTYNQRNKKNPLNIDLGYLKKQDYQGYKTLKLSNGYFDPSFVREVLSYSILQKYLPVPDCNFAEVYINDNFHGLYTNVEVVNKSFIERHYKLNPKRAFFKCNPEKWGIHTSSLEYLGEDSVFYEDKYQIKSPFGWGNLIGLTKILEGDSDNFPKFLDINSCLWMLAFNNVAVNLDSYSGPLRQNYYLFLNPAGQMVPIPWDMNMSFGGYSNTGNVGDTIGKKNLIELDVFSGSNNSGYPLIKGLLANPTYRKMYLAHSRTIVNENFANDWAKKSSLLIQKKIREIYKKDVNGFYFYEEFFKNLDESIGTTQFEKIIGVNELIEYRTAFIRSQSWYKDICPVYKNINVPDEILPNKRVKISVEMSEAKEVFVAYRNSKYEPFNLVPMFDDGEHNDGASNDGIFGIELISGNNGIDYYFYAQNERAGLFYPERAGKKYLQIRVNLMNNVVINEILSSNQNGTKDENGENEDWIELYNNSANEISLEGWYLSDDPFKLNKWSFPIGTTIKPKKYLIVWADNEFGINELHANFKLSASGEVVILSTPSRKVVDEVVFNQQKKDISYARFKNGIGNFASMQPTFNKENIDAVGIKSLRIQDLLKVFPNPTNNNVWISYLGKKPEKLEIFNLVGKKVKEIEITNEKTQLEITALKPGFYLFKAGSNSIKLMVGK